MPLLVFVSLVMPQAARKHSLCSLERQEMRPESGKTVEGSSTQKGSSSRTRILSIRSLQSTVRSESEASGPTRWRTTVMRGGWPQVETCAVHCAEPLPTATVLHPELSSRPNA